MFRTNLGETANGKETSPTRSSSLPVSSHLSLPNNNNPSLAHKTRPRYLSGPSESGPGAGDQAARFELRGGSEGQDRGVLDRPRGHLPHLPPRREEPEIDSVSVHGRLGREEGVDWLFCGGMEMRFGVVSRWCSDCSGVFGFLFWDSSPRTQHPSHSFSSSIIIIIISGGGGGGGKSHRRIMQATDQDLCH